MGADLCVSGIYILGNMTAAERQEKMFQALEKDPMIQSDWEQFVEANGGYADDIEGEELRECAKGAIEDFFNSTNNRDVDYISIPGGLVMISGGMSWGDSPTETYETIHRVNNIPEHILNAGKVFSSINEETYLDDYLSGELDDLPEPVREEVKKWLVARRL